MKTIFYVAGKSGGHIIPALTLAQRQQQQEPTICGIFSTDGQLDLQLIQQSPAMTHHVPLPVARVSLKDPLFLFRCMRAWYISLRTLYRFKPAVVVSTGGFVSVPVCSAAWMLGIPFDLYEFNVEPGAAIKFLASRARTVFTCFSETKRYLKCAVVCQPYPVRYEEGEIISCTAAREKLGCALDAKILMIVGGSQGSRFLNAQITQWVAQLSCAERAAYLVIHQTGSHDVQHMEQLYRQAQINAIVFAYRDDIAVCYQAADYIITRAGSGVLHELLFFKKRALIIPLEVASTGHQVANAQAFVTRDAASWTLVRQEDLQHDTQLLYRTLQKKLL
jgi:UDP-N-acetylglucosamine--N-acetylmuramyl-(pentapeptide) pyrophosphoryl-undecaprenol N-acetylglucosamine transferase